VTTTSISRRLIFWLAVPLLLMALLGALVHFFNYIAPGLISSDRRLKEATNTIMARIDVRDGRILIGPDAPGLPALPSPDSIRYAVRDSARRLIAGDAQLPLVPMGADTSQLFAMAQIDHRGLRTLTTRFDTRGGVTFITAADMKPPNDPAAKYSLFSSLMWDFAQLNITLLVIWVGIHLGLRPIKRLRQEIAQRSPLDLRPIVETTVPREIAPVVVTLNRLFALLRGAVQSQQQFIANTAHQLRTPITGMQAQLDLLMAEPAAQPLKERMLILQESTRQLAHSANQLLSLARADPSANITTKAQPMDLAPLIGEVAARYFDRALQLNIDLGVDIQGPALIAADASLMDDLLSNLVDNALKYTPSGGHITISLSETNGKAILTVNDSGPGIPEGERVRVRQRFYRMPNAPGHGSGLGLAIVDEIAQLFGGEMRIESGSEGRGTRISVNFASASR
jgi:two-component system sensor histidine kinase TctE